VFISVFIQAILLGIGMGILDDSDSGEVDAVSSAAFCGSSEVGVTRTLERAQSDSGFPREFTTLIIPTSKIKANVSITLVRPGSYGRPYG